MEPRTTEDRAHEVLDRHALIIKGGNHAIGEKAPTFPSCSCGAMLPEAEDRRDAHLLFQAHLTLLSEQDRRDRHWAVLVLQRPNEWQDQM